MSNDCSSGRNNTPDLSDEEMKRRAQTETTRLLHACKDDNDDIIPKSLSQSSQPSSYQEKLLSWLVVGTWISGILFGVFALFHYLRAVISCSLEDKTNIGTCVQSAWDRSDPNLYRPTYPAANRVMIAHLIGGVFLMFAGPIQFLASIRRHYMNYHRWIGRVYLVAAVVASGGGTLWTLIWRTSRCNVHEDVGNFILGSTVFVSAVQTYWHVRITKRIDLHQLWAWRLYACILGAPLYRLYGAIYGAFILYTPWQGSLFLEDLIFYIIVIPNLFVVQIIWTRKQERDNNLPVKSGIIRGADNNDANGSNTKGRLAETGPLLVKPVWIQIALVFIPVTTGLVFFVLWLPTILGITTGVAENIFHDFCETKEG